MDIFEFELRYNAYQGLATLCKLGRTQEDIISMVKIAKNSSQGQVIQELSPEQLKELTKSTYTIAKQKMIADHKDFEQHITKDTFYRPLGEYIERLEYELKVIKEMGFNTYMLVVSDFTTRAKNNAIMVGPGRGSGAGSLLAYLIKITDVNPFAYDLLFERFLNPARISMPDFDIDFEDTLRGKVIEYVKDKYGHDHVSAIGTYMTMATKAAFKDAARAVGIPFERSNLVSNLMNDVRSLRQIIAHEEGVNDELLQIYNQDQYIHNAIELGYQLEGNLRQLGVHACGIIIAPQAVTAYTATQIIEKNKEQTLVSQYEGPVLEDIGLLKMDFLGLRNLSVIKNCIKILRAKYRHLEDTGTHSEAEKKFLEDKSSFDSFMKTMSFNPPMNDKKVFEKVFMSGDTTGIFQFEGEGMRRFLVELRANHINDLVAMNALYRPGPMEFIPSYIKRKHGEEEINYMLSELKTTLLSNYKDENIVNEEKRKLEEDLGPILDQTYGIAVYQEQLMFLVQSMAGFSLPEADLLRRGVGKKKKEIIEELKLEFMKRGQSFRGYKPETTKIIYEKMIEPAASYSFNKSHAVCYAHIAYQTGYLKAHYPLEFYASLLRSSEEDTDRLSLLIDEVHNHGIRIEAPNINEAYNHIAAGESTIIMGFYACKGVGFEIGEQIEQERNKSGLFTSLENFLERCPFVANKRALESLIKAGAFDKRYDRNTLLLNLSSLIERHSSVSQLDNGLFGGLSSISQLQFQETSSTSLMDKCFYDIEIFKNMISGHPFDGLYPYFKKFGFIDQYKKDSSYSGPFSCVGLVKKITRARKKGYFIMIEDITDSFEFFTKDIVNIKLYDVFQITGYKSRNRTVKTLIKQNLMTLIQQAKHSKKYDENWTVAKVRGERRGEESFLQPSVSLEDEETQAIIQEQEANEGGLSTASISPQLGMSQDGEESTIVEDEELPLSSAPQPEVIELPLPDTIDKIKILTSILINHPGEDHIIFVRGKNYHISRQGMELIQKVLQE